MGHNHYTKESTVSGRHKIFQLPLVMLPLDLYPPDLYPAPCIYTPPPELYPTPPLGLYPTPFRWVGERGVWWGQETQFCMVALTSPGDATILFANTSDYPIKAMGNKCNVRRIWTVVGRIIVLSQNKHLVFKMEETYISKDFLNNLK